MGIFICCKCDNYSDSDDGCVECKDKGCKFGLICAECEQELPEDY